MVSHRAIGGVLALASWAAAAPTGGDAAGRYREEFGTQERKVLATTGTRDDAQFAAKLLKWARDVGGDPKLQALLCEKACEFGMKHSAGSSTAIEAARLLRSVTTGREAEVRAMLLKAYEVRYRYARAPERLHAGSALSSLYVEAGERALAAGSPEKAVEHYLRAKQIAYVLRLPEAREISARHGLAAGAVRARQEVARLEGAVANDSANAALAGRLLLAYLVEMDDPAKAAGLLKAADAGQRVRTYLPLAAKGIAAAPEAVCAELGRWYASLAAKAEGHGKYRMLRRARGCFERYMGLHETKDVPRVRLERELAAVRKELVPFAPPHVDMLMAVDLKRDVVDGQWQWTDRGLSVHAEGTGRVMLRAPRAPDYDLIVQFTRTKGRETICLTLPVGRRQCILILSGWSGAASGLGCIRGKDPSVNETTVRRKTVVTGRKHVVRVVVKTLDKGEVDIRVELDGKRLLSWRGPQNVLSVSFGEYAIPRKDAIGLCTKDCDVVFHSAKLRSLP